MQYRKIDNVALKRKFWTNVVLGPFLTNYFFDKYRGGVGWGGGYSNTVSSHAQQFSECPLGKDFTLSQNAP